MGFHYKWQPNQSKKRKFAKQMQEIDKFCEEHEIYQSKTSDSYYFTVNGVDYRVSNHSVESSVWKDDMGYTHNYHDAYYRKRVVCIHASKTRIIEIYNKIVNGYELDGKGNIKVKDE